MTTQLIKKLFAILYLVYSFAISITGVHVFVNHGLDLSWGGVLLISVPVIVTNGDRLLKGSVTNHRYLAIITTLVLLGFLISVSSLLGGIAVGPGAFVAAVAGVLAYAVYRFWYLEALADNNPDQPPAA